MPLYSDPTPSWLKSENAKPSDPLALKGLRAAANWTGMTNPKTAFFGIANSMLTPIIQEGLKKLYALRTK
jgi:hypothetical protein